MAVDTLSKSEQPMICAPAQQRLVSEDVILSGLDAHVAAVKEFYAELDDADTDDEAPPSVHGLFLPHPEDAWQHAAQQAHLAGRDIQSVPTGAYLDTFIDLARSDLDAKYRRARALLHTLQSKTAVHPINKNKAHAVHWHDYQYTPPANPSHAPVHAAARSSDLLVQIAVHNPHANFAVSQVILAHADHTLDALRREIYCVADLYAAKHLPQAPSGALFYLNNTLFHNACHPGSHNYATPVQAFLHERSQAANEALNRFLRDCNLNVTATRPPDVPQAKPMDNARLRDLNLSLSQTGYLYSHAGACEHMLSVQDVRLKHADDPDGVLAAPVTVYQMPKVVRSCCLCAARAAEIMAFDDVLAPSSPAFFCNECFDDLHLSAEGRVLPAAAGATVYDYIHD